MTFDFAKAAQRVASGPQDRLVFGTAGFRASHKILDTAMYWCGVLAARRALNTGKTVGIVVTASHNLEEDNGIKLVDPDGGMLEGSWEALATRLVAARSEQEIAEAFGAIPAPAAEVGSRLVLIGRDTRSHSPRFAELVTEGVRDGGGEPRSLGIVTTPQLHWAVQENNVRGLAPEQAEAAYYDHFANAFKTLVSQSKLPPLVFDGANGVGAAKFAELVSAVKSKGVEWDVTIINKPGDGALNEGVGSEHVQKTKSPPRHVDPSPTVRVASVDGDADRIVYSFFQEDHLMLLDGDKISALIAAFLRDIFAKVGLGDVGITVVQTAYANGASTDFIRGLGVDVAMAKTGVKHLHHKAAASPVGIYFEANGHGTMIFSPAVRKRVAELPPSPEASLVAAIIDVVNAAIGDAMSDLLLVESLLALQAKSLGEWAALYHDLPSVLSKVIVPDRYLFTCNDDETQCLQPSSLQPKIDAVVKQFPRGRSFVRPSGTGAL